MCGRLFPQVVARSRTRSGSSPVRSRRPVFKMEGILNTGPPCPTSHMAMCTREALPLLVGLEVRPGPVAARAGPRRAPPAPSTRTRAPQRAGCRWSPRPWSARATPLTSLACLHICRGKQLAFNYCTDPGGSPQEHLRLERVILVSAASSRWRASTAESDQAGPLPRRA